ESAKSNHGAVHCRDAGVTKVSFVGLWIDLLRLARLPAPRTSECWWRGGRSFEQCFTASAQIRNYCEVIHGTVLATRPALTESNPGSSRRFVTAHQRPPMGCDIGDCSR